MSFVFFFKPSELLYMAILLEFFLLEIKPVTGTKTYHDFHLIEIWWKTSRYVSMYNAL